MHERFDTPASLVQADGLPTFGWFKDTVAELGLERACVPHPMGGRRPSWVLPLRLKSWDFISVDTPTLLIGVAIVDLSYADAAFAYVFDKRDQSFRHWQHRTLPWEVLAGRKRAQMTVSPLSGQSIYNCGRDYLEIGRQSSARRKTLAVKLPSIGLRAELQLLEDYFATEPLSLCLPAGADGWTYTNKLAGMPVTGKVILDGVSQDFEVGTAWGGHDYSVGLMRRETTWNWSFLSAVTPKGALGLNMATGVNESGQTENALWLDGRLHKVASCWYQRAEEGVHVSSSDSIVDLSFRRQTGHGEHANYGLLASRFMQWVGRYEGRLSVPGLMELSLPQTWGLWEDHYVKW